MSTPWYVHYQFPPSSVSPFVILITPTSRTCAITAKPPTRRGTTTSPWPTTLPPSSPTTASGIPL
ncbi:hypothetical protein PC116_g34824 [Phytophthora cactorum]|nr:hypothetical protein PC116_g34824 [Phytophthora cactorum]